MQAQAHGNPLRPQVNPQRLGRSPHDVGPAGPRDQATLLLQSQQYCEALRVLFG